MNPRIGRRFPACWETTTRLRHLATVVRSFKAAVTRELRISGIHGDEPVWQPNYYDRVVRDDAELKPDSSKYIAANPLAWQYDRENPRAVADEAYERAWQWLEKP